MYKVWIELEEMSDDEKIADGADLGVLPDCLGSFDTLEEAVSLIRCVGERYNPDMMDTSDVRMAPQFMEHVSPGGIHGIYREMAEHPDYCGGTFWTKEDLARAIYKLDQDDDEPPTAKQIASITEEMRQLAIKTTENYVFRDYSWADALEDCGVLSLHENAESDRESAQVEQDHRDGKHTLPEDGLLFGCVQCSEEVK